MREVLRMGASEGLMFLGDKDHDIYLRWVSFHSGQVEVPATLHIFSSKDETIDEMDEHVGFFGIPLDANGEVIPSTVQVGHLYRNLVLDCVADVEISLTYELVPRAEVAPS